ncbi:hypothetical protein LTR36_003514 [Oleoguttula mirabilis]|uniref:F-box domain-containing protein n=1 Tax=Oleoguttula mirabilis TaxID=1507867 RepID=A0AAV9JJM0_9PEZI|nr:hypothetical protein LTR36_003514 [Oleoguttula mirabilis]
MEMQSSIAAGPPADPLTLLPPEIVLRILEFASIATLAAATRLSKAWHRFIDEHHSDAIYSTETKITRPGGAQDFSFLQGGNSFAKYFDGTTSWKDLCKRQTLLPRNWDQARPFTRESVLQVGYSSVWRFRPDFKRRFFVSTSQSGGLNVTDMDTGRLLWRLPSTEEREHDAVRPWAHLEYQDGTAVWDSWGESVEVWKTDLEGLARGEFRKVAVLKHDCETRGFQLSYDTLCVVSTEGKGFVYDMKTTPPGLKTRLETRDDAVGHLDQNQDVVMYSFGTAGYHIHDKVSGKRLGILEPWHCETYYHINHPATTAVPALDGRHGPTFQIFPPIAPSRDRLDPLKLERGPLPRASGELQTPVAEDEWGAGMLSGDTMVGVSRYGRIFICRDWPSAIQGTAVNSFSYIVECDSDGAGFDFGGWLSVRNNRILFEIEHRIYVLALTEDGWVQDVQHPQRASYSLLTSSAPQLAVPVSFMALYDDCIMNTYRTLGCRRRIAAEQGQQHGDDPARIFPVVAIRILSFAPDLDGTPEQPALWEAQAPASEVGRAQTGLPQLDDEDEDFGLEVADSGPGWISW